jgi:hypothetical protein
MQKKCGSFGTGGSIPFLTELGKLYPTTQIIALGAMGPDCNVRYVACSQRACLGMALLLLTVSCYLVHVMVLNTNIFLTPQAHNPDVCSSSPRPATTKSLCPCGVSASFSFDVKLHGRNTIGLPYCFSLPLLFNICLLTLLIVDEFIL